MTVFMLMLMQMRMVMAMAAAAFVMGVLVLCMSMVMPMAVIVCVAVMVVAVTIIGHMAAIGAAFGLKRQISLNHRHVHAAQHVGQHVVGFNLEVVGLQLNGYMAVAQVVGSAHQVKGCAVFGAGRDLEHLLRCGNHAHHGAIFGDQHIAAAHGLAAWQKDGQFTALAVGGGKARFLAHIPVQLHGGSTLEQHAGQALALALGKEFVDGQHRFLTFKRGATNWRESCISHGFHHLIA